VRVRRNASDNVETLTIDSTSRPLLSSTMNMSLQFTQDSSNVSSGHNAFVRLPSSPNSTVLPANVTNSLADVLEILEVWFSDFTLTTLEA